MLFSTEQRLGVRSIAMILVRTSVTVLTSLGPRLVGFLIFTIENKSLNKNNVTLNFRMYGIEFFQFLRIENEKM